MPQHEHDFEFISASGRCAAAAFWYPRAAITSAGRWRKSAARFVSRCFAGFGADVEAFPQGGFDFGQREADCFADFVVAKHAVARELVNRSHGQTAMNGEFVAGDFLLGEDWRCL